MSYNGYTNHSTWLVALHLDNEQGDQEYWADQARQALRDFGGPDDAAHHLGDALADAFREQQASVTLPPVLADMLNASLGEVNWREVAGVFVDSAQEEDDDE